jgi:YD repeat-containing protein
MSAPTITIGDTTFDNVAYDRGADVLYLSVGPPQPAVQTFGTPEGHAVRYDEDGRIVGITLVNARLLLDRGETHVTIPQVVDLRLDELRLALA